MAESDPVARARALGALARGAADEAERERRLPERVAAAMAKEGLYRVATPRSFGGSEQPPATQIRVIEAIAEGDGAAGWNLMIGIESFSLMSAVFAQRAELFADPNLVVCSATSATGRAERVAGGVRVTGQWPFVSGCQNSGFFAGICALEGGDAPEQPVWALVPRGEFEILDTWNVSGLRGSGSHDVRLDGVFVPDENIGRGFWTALGEQGAAKIPPIFRIPLGTRLAYNKTGVGFGIARAAIDAFVELARGKTPFLSSTSLRERPFAQRALAQAEARLRGSRALVLEQADAVWETVQAGRKLDIEERALFQIACADAAQACAEAVDLVVEAAGTSANTLGSPLERCARDARVIRQHVTVAPHTLEDGGRVLLGLPPESVMLKLPS
jgi:alkylation response protein AidB-like acyl-CoA dehydrogenase